MELIIAAVEAANLLEQGLGHLVGKVLVFKRNINGKGLAVL